MEHCAAAALRTQRYGIRCDRYDKSGYNRIIEEAYANTTERGGRLPTKQELRRFLDEGEKVNGTNIFLGKDWWAKTRNPEFENDVIKCERLPKYRTIDLSQYLLHSN